MPVTIAHMPRTLPATVILCAGALSAPAAAQLGPAPEPPENPTTEAKRLLGKALFWDEQLASDNSIACGTCHIPSAGGSDPRLDMGSRHPGLDGAFGTPDDRFASEGVHLTDAAGNVLSDPLSGFAPQVTPRRSPSNIGAAHFDELFWDGRAGTTFLNPETGAVSIPSGGALENQSVGPILSMVEMADTGRTWSDVRTKLERVVPLALATNVPADVAGAIQTHLDYPGLFADAFGDAAITAERIGFALAAYQRTLNPDQTPWDAFIAGQTSALTSQERSGLNSFMSTGLRCSECHAPPLFSDGSYRNLGLRDIAEDDGRRSVTGLNEDRGRFKVPSLRNAGLRTRYFHNGDPTQESLFLAVFFYNQGAGFFLDNKDPILNSVFFSPSTAFNITTFIQNGLTDPRVAQELPPFDRPTLASERGSVATEMGAARPGTGGVAPRLSIESPAFPGAEEFRVVLHSGLGGAAAAVGMTTAAPGTQPAPGATPGARTSVALLGQKPLAPGGSGAGHATWHRPIPMDPALSGTRLYFRGLVRDPGAAGGVARTRWAEVTVQ